LKQKLKHCCLKLEQGRREAHDSLQHLHSLEDRNLTLLIAAIDIFGFKRGWYRVRPREHRPRSKRSKCSARNYRSGRARSGAAEHVLIFGENLLKRARPARCILPQESGRSSGAAASVDLVFCDRRTRPLNLGH
jgi:hypothetical protein